uniref:hypothetical protein n=1 Tax=Alloprevotella sp. TaxID=1872471 RepID=UPI003FF08755
MKVKKLSFSLPSRSLSYLKIAQGERNENESQKTFIFIAEPQPILSKDSARRAQ